MNTSRRPLLPATSCCDLIFPGRVLHRNPMGNPRRGGRIKAFVIEHHTRSSPINESASVWWLSIICKSVSCQRRRRIRDGRLSHMEETDVIVSGCGPTGAMLSTLLGRYQVPNVVLEREPTITRDPRGIALDEDGIRHLQACGIYDKIFTDIGGCKLLRSLSTSHLLTLL